MLLQQIKDFNMLNLWMERQIRTARSNGRFVVSTIPYTPLPLIVEMFERIDPVQNRMFDIKIAVVYTIEMAVYLKWLGFKNVTLITTEEDQLMRKNVELFGYEYKLVEEVEGMKFDCVVGNPPWNEGTTGTNRDIYDEFLYLAMDLSDRVAFIVNGTFLWSGKKQLGTLRYQLSEYGVLEIYEKDTKKIFNVDADCPAAVVFLHKGNKNIEFPLNRTNGTVNNISLHQNTPVVVMSPITNTIFKKVYQRWSTKINARRGRTRQLTKKGDQTKNGKGFVSYQKSNQYQYKTLNRVSNEKRQPEWVWCDTIIDDDISSLRVAWGIISTNLGLGPVLILPKKVQVTQMICYEKVVNSEEANSLKLWLQSKLFRFMLNTIRVNTTNSLGVLRKLPRPMDSNIFHPWTDEELYKHFNLTQEERDLIETTIK